MIGLVNADTRRIPLADKSVHMVATSVPYFGLRSYLPDNDPLKAAELGTEELHDCLAWARGERPCRECFVCALRIVSAETWRVLRDDGTFWMNLGDSFSSNGGKRTYGSYDDKNGRGDAPGRRIPSGSLPAKNLMGIPWRVALALQADGWYLRSDVIWSKPNPMPESVRDRPTRSHEYVFLLAKSARYFYDQDAIREDFADERMGNPGAYRWSYANSNGQGGVRGQGGDTKIQDEGWNVDGSQTGRNARTVWELSTEGFAGAHFATWPTALVEKMILAGTSERGCCPRCKAPYVRITRKGEATQAPRNPNPVLPYDANSGLNNGNNGSTLHMTRQTETAGWRPSCKCSAYKLRDDLTEEQRMYVLNRLHQYRNRDKITRSLITGVDHDKELPDMRKGNQSKAVEI